MPVASNGRPQNQHMAIICRKPITIPLWVRIVISLSLAAVLTLVAFLLTQDYSRRVVGKVTVTSAILVLPQVWAAKSEWSATASIAFAFFIYFLVCFGAVWFFTHEKLSA